MVDFPAPEGPDMTMGRLDCRMEARSVGVGAILRALVVIGRRRERVGLSVGCWRPGGWIAGDM
jgi:hypothetical protein